MNRRVIYRANRLDNNGQIESESIDYHRSGKVFLKVYTSGTWFQWVEVDPKTMWIRNDF